MTFPLQQVCLSGVLKTSISHSTGRCLGTSFRYYHSSEFTEISRLKTLIFTKKAIKMSNFKQLGLGLFCLLMLMTVACKKDKASGPQYGTVTDIEGNVYKTIKIGDQEWMAENLKTHKLNDGTPIAYVTSDATWADVNNTNPMMCYYDNDVDNNKDKYGALYNWYAVNTGKLPPAGWHVPTDADWKKLEDYLIANGYNYDGTTTGNKIAKSLAAKSGWEPDLDPGNVGNDQASNNKAGFYILPAGYRSESGTFLGLGVIGYFKSAGHSNNYWGVEAHAPYLNWNAMQIGVGLPIRCVKD